MRSKDFATFDDALSYVASMVEKEVGLEEEVYNYRTFASQAMKDRVFEDEGAKMDSKFFVIVSPQKVFYSETLNHALELADACPNFKHVIKLENQYGKKAYVEFINYKGREDNKK